MGLRAVSNPVQLGVAVLEHFCDFVQAAAECGVPRSEYTDVARVLEEFARREFPGEIDILAKRLRRAVTP